MHIGKRSRRPHEMKRSGRRAVVLGGLLLGAAFAAHAQTVAASSAAVAASAPTGPLSTAAIDDLKWKSSLDAFSAADQLQAPTPGGVLFVGSSSIRLWADLEKSFETQPVVIKRGFGGSRLADCAHYLQRLVLPYKPRLVVVYAGDNDLAEGATPQNVLASFVAFVQGVRRELPDTRIAYLSIKPSPLRESLIIAIQETNALISAYTRSQPNLDYIDVYSKMLSADGRPRGELFGADMLHMNAAGYALWKQEIAGHLTPAPP